MSYYTKKRHLDANHKPIVNALKQIGCSVGESDAVGKSFPDLVVSLNPNKTVLIEVKQPDGQLSITQLRFLAEWKGYSAFASTELEAINAVRFPEAFALSERDKLKILQIVLRYEEKTKAKYPQIRVTTFEKEFAILKGETK